MKIRGPTTSYKAPIRARNSDRGHWRWVTIWGARMQWRHEPTFVIGPSAGIEGLAGGALGSAALAGWLGLGRPVVNPGVSKQ
jgi:hypothetical protein